MSTVLLRAAVLGGFPRTGPTVFDRVRMPTPSRAAAVQLCEGGSLGRRELRGLARRAVTPDRC
jgi:hypothetical protein